MAGHAIGTHEAALRLALGLDELPDAAEAKWDPDIVLDEDQPSLMYRRPFRGRRILDLGAGPNPWPWVAGGAEYIAQRKAKVTVDLPGVEGPPDPHLWRDRHITADLNRWGCAQDEGCDALYCAPAFDVVVALELIEHVENPWSLLRLIAAKLAPGGFAIISSPDVSSDDARRDFAESGRLRWFPADFRPSSLGHITPIFPYIFREMARRAGLQIVAEAFNEPPPHWIEEATDDEQAGVRDQIRVWRLEQLT